MVLYSEEAWQAFYSTLHSSGVLGALLDTGETASAATAKKALAAAKAANRKVTSGSKKKMGFKAGAHGSGKQNPGHANRICYYCTSTLHYGRHCPLKKKGEPPTADSKAGKAKANKKAKKKK